VPVRAVVLLRESAGDQIALERVATTDAIRDLWTLAFRLPQADDRSRAFQQVVEVADRVPVWNLSRPMTMNRLPDVVAAVAELCTS
jgi:predicted membrane-bound mannosyltransferase